MQVAGSTSLHVHKEVYADLVGEGEGFCLFFACCTSNLLAGNLFNGVCVWGGVFQKALHHLPLEVAQSVLPPHSPVYVNQV